MNEAFQSILVGTAGLSIAAIIAAALSLSREVRLSAQLELQHVLQIAVLAIVLHCIHFTEEWYTGFHTRFPVMLGLVPWPTSFFLSFNAIWVAIWCLSVVFLRRQPRISSFPIWFLAIASAANGVLHPGLSVASGGYFPGLWSSPLVGLAGVVLLRALGKLTQG